MEDRAFAAQSGSESGDAFRALFEAQVAHVWRSLRSLGVDAADVADASQQVFLVLHANLARWNRECPLRAFMYGICLRVASDYRRRSHRRHERLFASPPDIHSGRTSPEDDAVNRQELRLLVVPTIAYQGLVVKQLSLGEYHSCALFQDGTVSCAGSNSQGQLGDGTTVDRAVPTLVNGLGPVSQIAAGANFTCALLLDQTVSCWGTSSGSDVCADNNVTHTTPTPVAGVAGALRLAAGSTHTCAVLRDKTVTCWGLNFNGELGAPSPVGSGCPTYAHGPIVVPGLDKVVDVSAGDGHTCALQDGGTALCWGDNTHGQLGDGTKVSHDVPTLVPGLTGITKLVAGYEDACAILPDGSLSCWGMINPYGSTVIFSVPTPVVF
jgi:alpha-tubulin suppressor-like RCC1 family protein